MASFLNLKKSKWGEKGRGTNAFPVELLTRCSFTLRVLLGCFVFAGVAIAVAAIPIRRITTERQIANLLTRDGASVEFRRSRVWGVAPIQEVVSVEFYQTPTEKAGTALRVLESLRDVRLHDVALLPPPLRSALRQRGVRVTRVDSVTCDFCDSDITFMPHRGELLTAGFRVLGPFPSTGGSTDELQSQLIRLTTEFPPGARRLVWVGDTYDGRVAVSPSGRLVAKMHYGTLGVGDISSGLWHCSIDVGQGASQIDFVSDDRVAVLVGGTMLCVFDAVSGQLCWEVTAPVGKRSPFAMSKTGSEVVWAHSNAIATYATSTGELKRSWNAKMCDSISLSPDGSLVAAVEVEQEEPWISRLRVWNMTGDGCVLDLRRQKFTQVCFGGCNTLILGSSEAIEVLDLMAPESGPVWRVVLPPGWTITTSRSELSVSCNGVVASLRSSGVILLDIADYLTDGIPSSDCPPLINSHTTTDVDSETRGGAGGDGMGSARPPGRR